MSQSPSPFSIPDPTPPQSSGATRNTVVIVAIISLTLLLMCGGVVGLGIYAVDRLADQMNDFIDEDDWDNQDSEIALQFAIEQDATIRDQVGEIDQITSQDELTYDFGADSDDYFYDVKGSKGDAIVVVVFDEDEKRWFKSVELVQGTQIDSPRVPLQHRNAPFDTEWSKQVYDLLAADDHALAESLSIGPVTWIIYDYDRSLESKFRTPELLFEIQGENGTKTVVAGFSDAYYDTIRSIHIVDEDGNKQQQVYSSDAAATATMNEPANEKADPPTKNAEGENASDLFL
ncbi:MAG: hypothetical protein KDB00_00855 [Planctomycetales bacterium]|nr:hypothetical protein [Planctomycetales bacterium]